MSTKKQIRVVKAEAASLGLTVKGEGFGGRHCFLLLRTPDGRAHRYTLTTDFAEGKRSQARTRSDLRKLLTSFPPTR